MKALATTLSVMLAACAGSAHVPGARFANAPPVAIVDDHHDVPAVPEERVFLHSLYHYDGIFQRRLSRLLEVPGDRRALGVNALDEVPDSSWFTNRGALTADQVRIGPLTIESPELHKPWTVKSTKVGGSEIGFIITDARGEKFLLKFDTHGFPEQETSTHVIVDRLLWACGYNVTEDFVVDFRREELVLAPDAVVKDEFGHKHPLDRAELDRRLDKIIIAPDGRIRAMASRWLGGKPLGGPPAEGVRADDSNDRIPHELRRDLRGAQPIFAWLDHVDMQEGNFLDMWIADPLHPGRHYVKHYMVDFGKSLGVMVTTGRNPRHGHEYVVDLANLGLQFVTAGLRVRSWEGREISSLTGIASYDAETFDPGDWHSDSPAYVPIMVADRVDRFWGAKLMMRLTRAEIRAAVEAGRLSDPRAVEYLTDALVARQRKTAAYWFARTNPLDDISMLGDQLCFDDLTLVYRLGGPSAATRYHVTTYARDGARLAAVEQRAFLYGRTCTGPLRIAPTADAYTIVEIATARPDFAGVTYVHVARDQASGKLRVIGIWRP